MMDTLMEITEDKRGAEWRFESGEAIWLSRSLLREHCTVRVGDAVDVDELKAWMLPRQYPLALNEAVAMLAARACATGEIRRRLTRRRYLPDTVEMVLYKLEKEQLVNDEAFARDWAASRARRQMGKSRILMELRQKGISSEMAEAALESLDEDERDEAAVALAGKLLRRYEKEPDERKAMGKLLAAMARRGYGYEDARRAVEAALERAKMGE